MRKGLVISLMTVLVGTLIWSIAHAQPFSRLFYRNGAYPTTDWDNIHLVVEQTGQSSWGTDVVLEYWRDTAGHWRVEIKEAKIPGAVGIVHAFDGQNLYRLFPGGNVAESRPAPRRTEWSGLLRPDFAAQLAKDVEKGIAQLTDARLNGADVAMITAKDAAGTTEVRYWVRRDLGLVVQAETYRNGKQISYWKATSVDFNTQMPAFPSL